MVTIDRSRIRQLLAEAEGLPHGVTRIGLLEEATRLADILADIDLGFEARQDLVEASNFGGAPEKAMVAFSWCLAHYDRDPGRFPDSNILWRYKWTVCSLPVFPQISRAQIMKALADVTARVERAGFSMRPIYKIRYHIADKLGDRDEAREAYALWADSTRDSLSDCPACDRDDEVWVLVDDGRDEEAVAHARPILTGRQRCLEVPHVTYSRLLLPLVKLGRLEEASNLHLKGYRLIARNRQFLFRIAEHIRFLALTDNLDKGTRLFDTHLPWALETFDLYDRFHFSIAAGFLFRRVAESGKAWVRLRLPGSFPAFQEAGRYDVAKLLEWLDADAADLARRFDERNGNGSYTAKIEAARGWHALVSPHSVKRTRKTNVEPPG